MNRIMLCAALAAVLGTGLGTAHAESFTYHGTLQDAGKPADGRYDLQLTLYSTAQGGSAIATPVQAYGVNVHEGTFSTNVDFGALSGLQSKAWLEVAVKPAGSSNYATLDSRSPVSPDVNSCPGAWSLDGNSGNPAGSYIGTADAQDVSIRAGGTPRVTLVATKKAVGLTYGAADGTSGDYSTALSYSNHAKGNYSLAGGYSGGTAFEGSFVWGDHPVTQNYIYDSAPNQFIVQAHGGVGINTSHAEGTNPLDATLTIGLPSGTTGNPSIKFVGTDSSPNWGNSISVVGFKDYVQSGPALQFVSHYGDNNSSFTNATFSSLGISFNTSMIGNQALLVGSNTSNGNGAYLTNGGVWTSTSSRAFKESFSAVNVEAVLSKLIAMPVQTWFYKQSHAEGLHMGPVAEDFAASFGLGNDDKHVGSVDESGVAFAAIQGLNKKVEDENAQLKHENAELRGKLDDLATRLAKLESGKGE